MATRSKTRSELKQYFVKNAIPTESNFADLIDGQLNQSDDGVFKQPDQPLAVVAAGGEQKRVLQLYSTYPAANPDWLLNLNPRPLGASSGTAAGFGIADGTGATRLMLDAAGNLAVTGNLGYSGSLSKLDVAENGSATVRAADFNFGHSTRHGKTGRAFVDSGDTLVINWAGDWPKATIGSGLTVGGDLQVSGARIRNSSGLGLLEANANDLLRINPDGAFPAIAVFKPMSLGTGGLVVGSFATAKQGELVVTGSASIGNGLNVALPGGTGGGWNQFAVSLTNGWGDAGANFATIGAGGAAGIMFNNPHVAWDARESRASIRYGRTGGKAAETWWDAGVRTDGAFTWNAGENKGIGEVLRLEKTGQVSAIGGALLNAIGVGTQSHGATTWPYETIQMNPANNLRIWFGKTERFRFQNDGAFVITLDGGTVTFQTDGNLVIRRKDGTGWDLANSAAKSLHW